MSVGCSFGNVRVGSGVLGITMLCHMCALNEGWVGNSISPYKLCRSEYSQYSLHMLCGCVSGNRDNWSSVFMRFAFSVAKISGFDGAGMGSLSVLWLGYFLSSRLAREYKTDDIND